MEPKHSKVLRKARTSKYLFRSKLIMNLSTLFIVLNLQPQPDNAHIFNTNYETPFSASNIFSWFSSKPVTQLITDNDGLRSFNWTYVVQSNKDMRSETSHDSDHRAGSQLKSPLVNKNLGAKSVSSCYSDHRAGSQLKSPLVNKNLGSKSVSSSDSNHRAGSQHH